MSPDPATYRTAVLERRVIRETVRAVIRMERIAAAVSGYGIDPKTCRRLRHLRMRHSGLIALEMGANTCIREMHPC